MKEKVGMTTFVFGKEYQEYIPFLIYSIKKSYPEYIPIIFLNNSLREKTKKNLRLIKPLGKFIIKENYANRNLNRFRGKALRWLIRDDILMRFDYIYFVDIDMLYFEEPIPLHIQHKKHMKVLDLPFSNVLRKKINENRKMKIILKRAQKYGIKNAIYNFIRGKVEEKRLTGLHFVKVNEYFERIKESQNKYRDIIFNKDYKKYFQGFSDEPVLYKICNESGFNMNNLGTWEENPVKSLNFNNFSNPNFRPHHGIHLGLFRGKNIPSSKIVAESEVYQYYAKKMQNYIRDDFFIKLLENSKNFIQEEFKHLFEYYSIKNSIKNNI